MDAEILSRDEVVDRILRRVPLHQQAMALQAAMTIYGSTEEEVRPKFTDFIRDGWAIVEPEDFVWGRHLDAIGEHLQAVIDGQIRKLLITMPPRHCKSLAVAVFWPAYTWSYKPGVRWLFTSYNEDLAMRDSVKCRRIIESPWYQRRWGHRVKLVSDQNQKMRYENTAGGVRLAAGQSGGTGEGGSVLVADDWIDLKKAWSDSTRDEVNRWWDGVMSTRGNDQRTVAKVIVGQRSHPQDLAGHVLEQCDWVHLDLPAEFDGRHTVTSIHWQDWRTEENELLWPERVPREELEQLKVDLGPVNASAQLQQKPVPIGGTIFQRSWWRFHYPGDAKPPPLVRVQQEDGQWTNHVQEAAPQRFDWMAQSWDLSFDDTKAAAYVAGQIWGVRGANAYLMHQVRRRMNYPATVTAIKEMTERFPRANVKLVEKKANGAAVIATLRNEVPGLVAIKPTDSKESRAHAVSGTAEAGNVYLPHPHTAPWVNPLLAELGNYPQGYNDTADALIQFLLRFNRRRRPFTVW